MFLYLANGQIKDLQDFPNLNKTKITDYNYLQNIKS